MKKSTSIAKKGFLRKGFLNLHPTSIAPSVPPREVKDVWEKAIEFWERLPLEWALERDKMLAHQKTKGKRKLLNLKSSINYGDVCTPLGVGKARLTWRRVVSLCGSWGILFPGFRLFPCGFRWVCFVGYFGCSFRVLGFSTLWAWCFFWGGWLWLFPCILHMYLEAPYAFILIKLSLLIKKKF